jgi:hypothetical protein
MLTGALIARSAAMARSARYSCTKPSSTANSTITVMAIASTPWPSAADSAVATSRISTSALPNCCASSCHGERRRARVSTLGPCSASRRAASAGASPCSLLPSTATTEAAGWAYGGGAVMTKQQYPAQRAPARARRADARQAASCRDMPRHDACAATDCHRLRPTSPDCGPTAPDPTAP